MKRILLSVLATILWVALSTAQAADTPAAAGRSQAAPAARVATGAKVSLVASAQSAQQWSAQRPQAGDLRPKNRGTFD